MSIGYVCSWCGTLTTAQGVDDIDSGTVLTCSEPGCEGDTVVDLSTPAERSRTITLVMKAPVDAKSIQALLEEWAAILQNSDSIQIGRATTVIYQLGSITRHGFRRAAAFIYERLAEA